MIAAAEVNLQKLSAGVERQPKQTFLLQVSSKKTTEKLRTVEQGTPIRGIKELNSAGDHTKRTEARKCRSSTSCKYL